VLIAVVAHEKRRALAETLVAQVGASYVHWDDGTDGCFASHWHTWHTLERIGQGWCVVLEDDAVPVPGFRDQLRHALSVAPSEVVSLYMGRSRPRAPQRAMRELIRNGVDTHWITAHDVFSSVAIAMRAHLIGDMLNAVSADCGAMDKAMGRWVQSRFLSVGYTWPSQVDHADVDPVIEEHPDGQPRGPVQYREGMPPVLQRRIAWRTGTRKHWDTTTYDLVTQ
jgi:hypothetical protein